MSVHVSSWAWKQKLGDAGLKLVLVKLADNANDEGVSWWKQKRLADECEMSPRTVQRKLKELVERGLLVVSEQQRGDGARKENEYRLQRPPRQTDVGPHDTGDVGPHDTGDVGPHDTAMSQQEPSVGTVKGEGSSSTREAAFPVAKVSSKKVTQAEGQLALAVMDAFNEQFGTDYRGGEHFIGVVCRIRERPDIDLARHRELIGKLARQRWWRQAKNGGGQLDHPTPRHLYGSGKALDFVVMAKEGEEEDMLSIYTRA